MSEKIVKSNTQNRLLNVLFLYPLSIQHVNKQKSLMDNISKKQNREWLIYYSDDPEYIMSVQVFNIEDSVTHKDIKDAQKQYDNKLKFLK